MIGVYNGIPGISEAKMSDENNIYKIPEGRDVESAEGIQFGIKKRRPKLERSESSLICLAISDLPEDHAQWRKNLAERLESHITQLAVLMLVIIDVILVVSEIILHAGCQRNKNYRLEAGLHKASISILSVLLFKMLLLIVALGVKFFSHFWYDLDVIILIVSLVLDLVLHSATAGLFVLLMFWRVVRIIHGFYSTCTSD